MATIRDYAEVETWTVKTLIDATSKKPIGSKKVTIPEFQRRLVWSKDKQEKLILSIKSGFPFGSILLYEDINKGNQDGNSKRYYNLIDGLQRTQALRRYTENPNSFFSKENLSDEFIDFIANELEYTTIQFKDDLRRAIVRWVQNIHGFSETDGWGTTGLTNMFVRVLLKIEPDTNDFWAATGKLANNGLLQNKLATFLQMVREDADISEAKIPVIIYTGPSSELPSVFELLNSQGTALSRYEIFAAQWIEERQVIKNKEIIDAIWQKYEALEDEGFTLDVSEQAPDSKSRRSLCAIMDETTSPSKFSIELKGGEQETRACQNQVNRIQKYKRNRNVVVLQ